MSESEPISAQARLKQLQAIPERLRTDAEWDELNELEIRLAGGNREGAPPQHARGNVPPPGGRPDTGGRPRHGKRQGRKFHQKPPRPR